MFFTTKPEPKTVDGILSAFRSTINDLLGVAAEQKAVAAEQDRIIAKAQDERTAALVEATRAEAVATQMEAVFGTKGAVQ
jgi:hypothetical protein